MTHIYNSLPIVLVCVLWTQNHKFISVVICKHFIKIKIYFIFLSFSNTVKVNSRISFISFSIEVSKLQGTISVLPITWENLSTRKSCIIQINIIYNLSLLGVWICLKFSCYLQFSGFCWINLFDNETQNNVSISQILVYFTRWGNIIIFVNNYLFGFNNRFYWFWDLDWDRFEIGL